LIKICGSAEKTDYNDLLPEQKIRFGFLISSFQKQGYSLPDALEKANALLWSKAIPFE
jgi:hypothetical protein